MANVDECRLFSPSALGVFLGGWMLIWVGVVCCLWTVNLAEKLASH